MAPIKNILAALALASFTTAIPVALDKRVPANTVTETTWTTVDVTTTVYVDEASPQPKVENAPPAAPAATTPAAEAAAPESSPAAASSQPPAAAAQGNAPAAFAAQPAQPSTPVASSAEPVASPPAQSASTNATPAKSGGASSGGACEGSGSGCAGDATHWDGGLGACGWNVNTASDMQIALPVGLMGSQSNGNPYCGRSVSIKGSGGTVSATVGDKCMGCEGDSIDMTDALFAAAFPNGDGRVSNVEWWFD